MFEGLLVCSHIYQGHRPVVSHRADAKGVFELGHDDMDGSSGGVASDQRLRQVGHHETKLDQSKQNLHNTGRETSGGSQQLET